MTDAESRVRTHGSIDQNLWGQVETLGEGRAVVRLQTTSAMAVDAEGLVHGGHVFGLADHAAMLAVNEPTVVLALAEMAFLAPVAAGDSLTADAQLDESDDRRQSIRVIVRKGSDVVAEGLFRTATPTRHVLHR